MTIEYIIPHNPDHRLLQKAKASLQAGKVLCFPTETHWVLGVDLSSKEGSERLHSLNQFAPDLPLSLLCSTISEASELAMVSNAVFKQMKGNIPGPFQFNLHPTKKLLKLLKRGGPEKIQDKMIGIIIPHSPFVQELLRILEAPLFVKKITAQFLGEFLQVHKRKKMHERNWDFLDLPQNSDEAENAGPFYSYQLEEVLEFEVDLILDPVDDTSHEEHQNLPLTIFHLSPES